MLPSEDWAKVGDKLVLADKLCGGCISPELA